MILIASSYIAHIQCSVRFTHITTGHSTCSIGIRPHITCYSNYNFCTIMAISRQKEVGTMAISYRMTSRVLYSAQYHRQHCTLQAFEQFEALYIHNIDNKYLTRPGFKPSTFEFRMNHRGRPFCDSNSLISYQLHIVRHVTDLVSIWIRAVQWIW